MKQVMWVLVLGIAAGLAYWVWYSARRYNEKKLAEEARQAAFVAQLVGATLGKPPEDALAVAQQKLLFEAATKAAEAGEAVLSIQLFARLLARYPASALVEQARAAVDAQKKKLAKP
ncbi:MAG: hypothetical protein ACT4P9_16445 [Betaproteobacteria bacterium]